MGEDLPEAYNIADEAGNLFDNGAFAADAEPILDGAAGIDVTGGITVAQYDLVDGLATFDIANLDYSISDTWVNLYTRIGDPVLEDVVYEIDEAADYDFDRITEEEEAFIQGAANFSEDWSYTIVPESFTVAEALAAEALPDVYDINDGIDNLLTGDLAEMNIIDDADSVFVTDDATIAQIEQFNINYDNLASYNLADTAANLLDEANADIVDGADSISLSDAVTVAEYNDFAAQFDQEFSYDLSDTAANLLDEANAAVVDGADSISLSVPVTVAEYNDMVAQFGQEFGYELADTLENLLAADEGVVAGADSYSLTDAVDSFEGLAVADALSADELAMLDGAANAEDYTYSFADTLENLLAAEEGVLDAADEFSLTDAVDSFEGLAVADALSADELAMLDGATNTEDYTYSLLDTLDNLAAADEGVVDAADAYSLADEADAFEDMALADALDADEQAILAGAENAEDYQYTLADLAENFFEADVLAEGVAELLAGADAVAVTDEVTQAQREALLTEYEDATFPGGVTGNDITLVAADAGTDVSDQLSEFDDTITAEAGSLAGTTVVDPGGDSDTMTATVTTEAQSQAAEIDGIEDITFLWDAIGGGTVDLDTYANTEMVTVAGDPDRLGFNNNFTVNNAGANNVMAGDRVTNTLTVNDLDGGMVYGGGATTLVVDGVDNAALNIATDVATNLTVTGATVDSVAVDAGANLTVAASSNDGLFEADVEGNLTITAATATSADLTATGAIAVTNLDAATDIVLSAGEDSTITTADVLDNLTVASTNAEEAITYTVAVGEDIGESISFAGDNDITVAIDANDLDAAGVVNTGEGEARILFNANGGTDIDATGVDTSVTIELEVSLGANTLTVADGANLELSTVGQTDLTISGTAGVDDESVIVTSLAELADPGKITFAELDTATINLSEDVTDLELVTGGADTTVDVASDVALSLNSIADQVSITGEGDVNVNAGGANDIESIDAGELTGALTVAAAMLVNDQDATVVGGTGDNNVTFENTVVGAGLTDTYVGQSGDDTVTFKTTTATANASFVGGTNTVDAAALTTGTLIVAGGTGNDTVQLDAVGAAELFLDFGDGTGNVLDLTGADLTTVTQWQATNLNRIQLDGAESKMTAEQLHEQDYAVRGTGFDNSTLTVELEDGGDEVNLSSLNVLATQTTGATINIVGGDDDDVIVGTDGNDIITGDDGADELTGGDGADLFTYTAESQSVTGTGIDDIQDFETGIDQLNFDADAAGLFSAAISGGSLQIITGSTANTASLQTTAIATLGGLFGTFASKTAFISALTGITNGVVNGATYVAFAMNTAGTGLWVATAKETGTTGSDIDAAAVVMTIGLNTAVNAGDIVIS